MGYSHSWRIKRDANLDNYAAVTLALSEYFSRVVALDDSIFLDGTEKVSPKSKTINASISMVLVRMAPKSSFGIKATLLCWLKSASLELTSLTMKNQFFSLARLVSATKLRPY